MEFYTCEELRNICHENEIICTLLTKKEMYDLLTQNNLIDKVPEKAPLKFKNGCAVTTLGLEALNAYKEKYYLGEEFREFEHNM